MQRAGFVLAGGTSSRMGRDKALLPHRAGYLVEHIAGEVQAAAGCVTLVGPAERYTEISYPIIPDLIPGCGPLGGLHAALSQSAADWNLVVACDMPAVDRLFLSTLLAEASRTSGQCCVPLSRPGKPEPLCAVWHRDALPAIEAALGAGVRKMHRMLELLDAHLWQPTASHWFENVNTPEEWASHA